MVQFLILLTTGFVALLHIGFLILEMYYWDKPLGRKIFRHSDAFATKSKALAANQGLYNGFLSAGLIWGLIQGDAGIPTVRFFLGCVIVAGMFGGLTVNRKIIWIQAAPAALALLITFLAG